MSWLDDRPDLPSWMFPSSGVWEDHEPEGELSAIQLDALVLDLSSEPHIPQPARQFLEAFGQAHDVDLEQRGFAQFLDVIWPDGVPATLFVSNVGSDPDAPAHLRNLLLRPTCEGPRVMDPAIGGMTLGVQVYRRQGKLVVRALEVTPHVALRDFEARVSAPVVWEDPERFMSTGDFEALGGLVYQRAHTEARLSEWREYLRWKEVLIHKNRVAIPYLAWRWESETLLGFLVHEDALPDRKLVGLELGASARPQVDDDDDGDDSERTKRKQREPKITELGEVHDTYRLDPDSERDRQDWEGTPLTKKHGCVQFRLDEDLALALRERGLPRIGELVSSIAGDLGPLRNQQAGVDRLMRNQGFSPRLADFVFSSTSASAPLKIPDLGEIAEGRSLNPGQREAVAKALAAPDLCLIQGPPGTGKTTVISEICLRATRAGQRVLVASQTNLAVDNALGRLGDVPWVRPLRLGAPDRVDEEFRDFLAEYAVERWFGTIAEHCRRRISDAADQEATLAEQGRAVAAMRVALAEHRRLAHEIAEADAEALRAAAGRDRARSEWGVARQAVDDLSRRAGLLAELRQWAANDGGLPPGCGSEAWPVAVALPTGLDPLVPAAVALEQLRARSRPLRRVQLALERARAGASADVDAAAELLALREEKRQLVDSDRDSDLQRLGGVNRRIKALEAHGWNQITGELGRAARGAWPHHTPACIDAIVDALRPSDATDAARDEARGLVAAELELVDAAAEAIGKSAPHWSSEADALDADLQAARAWCVEAMQRSAAAADAVEATSARREAATACVARARAAWDGAFQVLWPAGDPTPPRQDVMASAERHVADIRVGLSQQIARARRWRAVQDGWVDRLGRISNSDRDHLQTLYVRNSNVVGMTCNEAGKRSTWQDAAFKPFDIVIVDEVSKATPPELILPLLLGRKAVLVGDHRQLPPMFREREASFGEAAEEGEVSKEDFERFRRMVTASLFQELFEQAPESIKSMLWTQYRMHPQIMGTVNQFYEGRLEAGPDAKTLAAARAHHLDVRDDDGGRLLAPSQHLLWVDTTKAPDGKHVWEEQHGKSKLNRLEVDVVVDLLGRLGSQLAGMGYGKTRRVQIPAECEGQSWAEALRALVPELPQETLDDLFTERRVRVDGRAQRPEGPVRVDVSVELRTQKEVGVITFYGAQLREIRLKIDAAASKHRSVFETMELRTNTVDRFQGMEKPIIIASLVRAKRGLMGSFVKEFQRINVGLSRAQQLLVIVGAEETWKSVQVPLPPIDGGPTIDVPAYQQMIELARRAGGRRLARQVLIR